MGETAAKALYEENEVKPYDTIEDAMNRAHLTKAVVEVLRAHGVFGDLPETDQLSWTF